LTAFTGRRPPATGVKRPVTSAATFAKLMAPMRFPLAVTLTSALTACGGGGGASSFGGMTQPEITTVPAESDTSAAASSTSGPSQDNSTSNSTSSDASTSTATSDGTVWDMGMPDFGPQQPAGCEGKIDFLFVISSAAQMKDFQGRLLASFPGFMSAIEEKLPDFNFHILAANTDKSWALNDCKDCSVSCDPQGTLPTCGAEFTVCDKKIGAAMTFPVGKYASNRRCDLDSGERYITSGQQNLADTFTCIAQVGIDGSYIVGEAMTAALQPEINDPQDEYACNGGFLRDDALLVVTLIQDTYDSDSLGTVEEWTAALRSAKNGDDDAFMVLVLTTDIDLGYQQICDPNQHNPNPNRLRTLADGVEHGFVGSICMDGYGDWFKERVAYLVDLCDDFIPPG